MFFIHSSEREKSSIQSKSPRSFHSLRVRGTATFQEAISPTIAAWTAPFLFLLRAWLMALKTKRYAQIATGIFLIFLCFSIVGTVLSPPLAYQYTALQSPSRGHYFGVDAQGRDLFLVLMQGSSVTLFNGCLAALGTFILGFAMGLLAGYVRGIFDLCVRKTLESLNLIPALFMVLVVQNLFFTWATISLWIAVVIVQGPKLALSVRYEVHRVRQLDCIVAARALGANSGRILVHHILPLVVPSVSIFTMNIIGFVVVIEAALAALNIGFVYPYSWGVILAQARMYPSAWWLWLFPLLLVGLVYFSTLLMAKSMHKVLEPQRSMIPL